MLLLGSNYFVLELLSLLLIRVSSGAIGCLRSKLLITWILTPVLRETQGYILFWTFQSRHLLPQRIPSPSKQRRSEATQVHSPLWEQFVTSKVAGLVHLFVEVSIFWLDSIRSQKDSCFWRAINVIIQNCLLHLKEEEALCDVLDQLFCHILWVEFGTEFEKQGAFFTYILCCHLEQSYHIL